MRLFDPIDEDKIRDRLNQVVDHLKLQAEALLSEQDGWELTITIPPITIRLKKPTEVK